MAEAAPVGAPVPEPTLGPEDRPRQPSQATTTSRAGSSARRAGKRIDGIELATVDAAGARTSSPPPPRRRPRQLIAERKERAPAATGSQIVHPNSWQGARFASDPPSAGPSGPNRPWGRPLGCGTRDASVSLRGE